jgi:hypothetical protein
MFHLQIHSREVSGQGFSGKLSRTVSEDTDILGFRTLSIVRIFLNNNEKTQRFGNWICFRPQVGKTPTQLGPLERANLNQVRKPNISVCYTPLSEPYSIYLCQRSSTTRLLKLKHELEY